MVDRRGVERFFARVWSHTKGVFGIEERRPDLLDALDARLRLQGYHPLSRCVVVGLGLAASYAIFYIFFVTREVQNLIYLLWLGGLLHQVVNRPRGVPVQWTRLLVAAAIPAINLFASWAEKVKDTYEACVNAAEEWCDTHEKCRDAFEACANASR
jgi:hypothetical protein